MLSLNLFSRTPALQIKKEAYIRALYKAVTLETGLVWAYRDDTNGNHHNHHHYQRRQGGAFPRATLKAFGGKSLDPSDAGAVTSATSGAGQRHLLAASSAQPYSQPSVSREVEAAANGGSGGGGGGGGGGGQGAAASESNPSGGLWAREAALRVEFLLQVMRRALGKENGGTLDLACCSFFFIWFSLVVFGWLGGGSASALRAYWVDKTPTQITAPLDADRE